MPIKEAITATLNGDSLISYKITNIVNTNDSNSVYFLAVIKDSASQTMAKKGIVNLYKTGDGIWTYSR